MKEVTKLRVVRAAVGLIEALTATLPKTTPGYTHIMQRVADLKSAAEEEWG